MPRQIPDAPTSTAEPDDLSIEIYLSLRFLQYPRVAVNHVGATERRSRDDADHAPVEHPKRSSPETLPDILTRQHVSSSDYSEDKFKIVLSFVRAVCTEDCAIRSNRRLQVTSFRLQEKRGESRCCARGRRDCSKVTRRENRCKCRKAWRVIW
jgi:hypothetical protein